MSRHLPSQRRREISIRWRNPSEPPRLPRTRPWHSLAFPLGRSHRKFLANQHPHPWQHRPSNCQPFSPRPSPGHLRQRQPPARLRRPILWVGHRELLLSRTLPRSSRPIQCPRSIRSTIPLPRGLGWGWKAAISAAIPLPVSLGGTPPLQRVRSSHPLEQRARPLLPHRRSAPPQSW